MPSLKSARTTQRPDAVGSRRESALLRLERPGCHVCRSEAEAERLFFFWFLNETMYDAAMIGILRASSGMCPEHSRRLLGTDVDARSEGSALGLSALYAYVLRAAIEGLRRSTPDGTCPACRQIRRSGSAASTAVAAALGDPEVEAAYRVRGGMCVPHFLEATAGMDRDVLELATSVLRERLASGGPGGAEITFLTGSDPDADRRSRLHERLAGRSTPHDHRSVIDQLVEDTRIEACPICLAGGRMVLRFLSWLAGRCATEDAPPRELVDLCASHANDLVRLDYRTQIAVTRSLTDRWSDPVDRFLGRLRDLPSASLPARMRTRRRSRSVGNAIDEPRRRTPILATLLDDGRRALSDARGRLLARAGCPACRVHAVAEHRQTTLLDAALTDARFRDVLDRSHGSCRRHLALLEEGDASRRVRERWESRASVVLWELDEAGRKSAWTSRFELAGDERTAFLRALALLDGRIFLGAAPTPTCVDGV